MAFDAEGLQCFAFGGCLGSNTKSGETVTGWAQKRLWHYATNDADTVVEANGYFDGAGPGPGDLIFASIDCDGTPEMKGYIVTGTIADVGVSPFLIA